jgi:hypothetical protein
LFASGKQKVLGLFLVDALTELKTEIDLAQAERHARLEAQIREYEQTGRPEAAAYLRATAEQLNLNLSGLADGEAGIQHLLLTDAMADPPPVPALPAPAGNGHTEINGASTRTPPPQQRRGPGRPPRNPSLPEPTGPQP